MNLSVSQVKGVLNVLEVWVSRNTTYCNSNSHGGELVLESITPLPLGIVEKVEDGFVYVHPYFAFKTKAQLGKGNMSIFSRVWDDSYNDRLSKFHPNHGYKWRELESLAFTNLGTVGVRDLMDEVSAVVPKPPKKSSNFQWNPELMGTLVVGEGSLDFKGGSLPNGININAFSFLSALGLCRVLGDTSVNLSFHKASNTVFLKLVSANVEAIVVAG